MRLALLEPPGDLPPARLTDQLAIRLARCGHDVTLLASGRRGADVGVPVVRRRGLARRLLRRFDYDEGLAFAPAAVWALAQGRFDVAHAFSPGDAWAAVTARRLGGPPFGLSLPASPARRWLVARRHRLAMLLAATEGAAWVTVPSDAGAAAFRRYLLRQPEIVALPPTAEWHPTVGAFAHLYEAARGNSPGRS